MRILTLGFAILLSCQWVGTSKEENTHPELELISVHQLMKTDTLNFDLSSISLKNDSVFIVADKPWNTFLYTIRFDDKNWYTDSTISITSKERFDLEAIDHCNDIFYLANEYTGSINKVNPETLELEIIPINFKENQLEPATWGNAGWEGLAIDCENQLMYLTKERQPRDIIVVDMNIWKIVDQFDIPQTESNDFADAKYQNGSLYLLERNGNFITKIDTKTKNVLQKYHYKHVASHPNGKLYAPTKYGMAEALLLMDDEIWIGLDNNGLEVSDYAKEAYQMKGSDPVIIKFKRPEGF